MSRRLTPRLIAFSLLTLATSSASAQAQVARVRVASVTAAPEGKAAVTLESGATILLPQTGLLNITSIESSPMGGQTAVIFGDGVAVRIPERDIVRLGRSYQRPNVLVRFAFITRAPDGTFVIRTLSGATVPVREEDLLTPITSIGSSPTDGKIAVVFGQNPSVLVPAGDVIRLAPPKSTAAQSVPGFDVGSKCAKDWPDDFAVRAYCEKRQREALDTLSARSMTTPDERTIRSKCAADWPDDYAVRNYCEERQLEALRQLGR